MSAPNDNDLAPIHMFRFRVDFKEHLLSRAEEKDAVALCSGAFAEISGLEATMEPKVIKVGGRNYGAVQRAGPVSFATVILKRGVTTNKHLWTWFKLVNTGGYAHRMTAIITQFDHGGRGLWSFRLNRALPIKFKMADLNARATEVGIEELHLSHEGLDQRPPEAKLFEGGAALP